MNDEQKPCSHPGCLQHVSHPCEGCGRIAGKGGRHDKISWIVKFKDGRAKRYSFPVNRDKESKP